MNSTPARESQGFLRFCARRASVPRSALGEFVLWGASRRARMAYSRRLGVVGILGVCFFVAVGCDDSDDKTVNEAEAGEGGESSSAGKGGKSTGGSSSN